MSLHSSDCFQMCAVSFSRLSFSLSLPPPFFHLPPPPKALRALLLLSSSAPPHPVCHQLWAQTGRAWCKAVKAAPVHFPAGLHGCSTPTLPLGVSQVPVGSQGLSDEEAVGPLRCCTPLVPLCPSKTSQQTHTWF